MWQFKIFGIRPEDEKNRDDDMRAKGMYQVVQDEIMKTKSIRIERISTGKSRLKDTD